MVRKIIVIGLLSLALASCSIFFKTPFPAALSLAENVVDLSGVVSDSGDQCEDCYSLHLLNNDNYLFLVIQRSQLIILDTNLNILKTYTNPDSYGTLGYYDSSATPAYIMGDMRYDSTFAFVGNTFFNSDSHGFYDLATAAGYYLRSTEGNLETWTGVNLVDPGINSIPFDLRLQQLTFDPGSFNVYLFFGPDRGDEDWAEVIEAPLANVTFGLTAGGTLFYPFGWPLVKLDGVDARTSYFTVDGFVGIKDGDFSKFDFSGNLESQVLGNNVRREAAAFELSGNYFYYYDGEAKKLYRCRTWWK